MRVQWYILPWILSLLATRPAAADYTPEELLLLMRANMERYTTVTCELSVTSYSRRDQNGEPKVQRTREIVSRWTPTRSLSRTTETYFQTPTPDNPRRTVTTVVITPQWNKELSEAVNGQTTPRGFIRSGTTYEPAFYGPMVAMWDINGRGFPLDTTHLDLVGATVKEDDMTGRLVLTCRIGTSPKAQRCVLHIDPHRDYIPLVKEFLTHDGRLLQRYECTVEKNPDGLWIPKEYSWHDPQMDYSTVYKVEEIQVNHEIPSDLLDFAFPSGTFVEDQIADLKYQVDETPITEDALDSLPTGSALLSEHDSDKPDGTQVSTEDQLDLQVRTIATEEELGRTFAKGENLGISQENERSASSYLRLGGIALIPCVLLGGLVFFMRRAGRQI